MRIIYCTSNKNNCPYYEIDNGYGYCSRNPNEDLACFWDEREDKKVNRVIYCPVNGWDCPYFDANGCCMMYPDTDPLKECEDFAMFWEEGEDYIVDFDYEPDVDETFYDLYMGCDFYE